MENHSTYLKRKTGDSLAAYLLKKNARQKIFNPLPDNFQLRKTTKNDMEHKMFSSYAP
jgi:hypothetical protein